MAENKDSKEKEAKKRASVKGERLPRKGDTLVEHSIFKGFFAPEGSKVFFQIRFPTATQEEKETSQLPTSKEDPPTSPTA